jgi:hypothetical protein
MEYDIVKKGLLECDIEYDTLSSTNYFHLNLARATSHFYELLEFRHVSKKRNTFTKSRKKASNYPDADIAFHLLLRLANKTLP